MADYTETITRYNALREACYERARAQAKAEPHWLTTAVCNADAEDIRGLSQVGDQITFTLEVWTMQTGGSNEYLEYSFPVSDVVDQILKTT